MFQCVRYLNDMSKQTSQMTTKFRQIHSNSRTKDLVMGRHDNHETLYNDLSFFSAQFSLPNSSQILFIIFASEAKNPNPSNIIIIIYTMPCF